MAQVGARVQAVEIHRVCFTSSLETATALHDQKPFAENAGYLARIAYCYRRRSYNVNTTFKTMVCE